MSFLTNSSSVIMVSVEGYNRNQREEVFLINGIVFSLYSLSWSHVSKLRQIDWSFRRPNGIRLSTVGPESWHLWSHPVWKPFGLWLWPIGDKAVSEEGTEWQLFMVDLIFGSDLSQVNGLIVIYALDINQITVSILIHNHFGNRFERYSIADKHPKQSNKRLSYFGLHESKHEFGCLDGLKHRIIK